MLGDTGELWREEPCGMTPSGVRQLTALPQLKTLSVVSCGEIDDSTLRLLADSGSLRTILVYGTKVTPEGVEAFREACPGCEVVRSQVYAPVLEERW